MQLSRSDSHYFSVASSVVFATRPSPTDESPIEVDAERKGDDEVDPLPTVDFEERKVYGHAASVLQNEDSLDGGDNHKNRQLPGKSAFGVALLLVFCRIIWVNSTCSSSVGGRVLIFDFFH